MDALREAAKQSNYSFSGAAPKALTPPPPSRLVATFLGIFLEFQNSYFFLVARSLPPPPS